MSQKRWAFYYIIFASIVFIIDRLSKYWAIHDLPSSIVINKFLSFTYTLNRGISFGMGASDSVLVFVFIGFIVSFLLIFVAQLAYTAYKNNLAIIGYLLVLAGGLSNLLDRFIYHGVIDFIALSYQQWSWPIFNIADIAVNLGILIIIIQSFRS